MYDLSVTLTGNKRVTIAYWQASNDSCLAAADRFFKDNGFLDVIRAGATYVHWTGDLRLQKNWGGLHPTCKFFNSAGQEISNQDHFATLPQQVIAAL
jgi:hypothetical protein